MEEGAAQPVRIVLDPQLKLIGRDFAVLHDGLPTLVYHHAGCDKDEEIARREHGSDSVTFVEMKRHADDRQYALSPEEIIRDLATRGLHHIMVEGGPTTARLFLNAQLVDRAILVRAPIQFQEPVPAGFDEETLKDAGLTMIGTSMMGGDTVEYWTKGGREWPAPEFLLWP
jgi:riboflavin biosynthesis pyrimidine reductase